MNDLDIGRLVYLLLLGGVLLAYLLIANREGLGATLRHAILWGLIFLGMVAGAMLWLDVRDGLMPGRAVSFGEGSIAVPRGPGGHYYATVEVNGVPVRFVIDTGATDVVLSQADARRVGIDPGALRYTGRARTANGVVETARVTLDEIAFGGFADRGIDAWVTAGEMDISLLGMSYLGRFDRIAIEGGELVLTR
jgi:aspartyl protease family protein